MTKRRRHALLGWAAVTAAAAWSVSCDPDTALDLVATALESPDHKAQKRTVGDLRDVGTAMMSWLTDQVGAAAAGQAASPPYDVRAVPTISREELQAILVPNYIHTVPELDGWGHPYEYHLNTSDHMARFVMSVRSPGRDGRFSGDGYTIGPFDSGQFDEDIVWADGFFVRWPERRS